MKKLIKHKHILHVLKNSRPKLRKVIVENMDTNTIKVISEIAKNTLNGVTEIADTKFHANLKKYKTIIRKLASRNLDLTSKRNLLLKSGRLLNFLLESIFSGVIGEIIEKGTV